MSGRTITAPGVRRAGGIMTAVAVGAATILAGAPGASADVVRHFYLNSTVYDYKITQVPDLDQRRTTLGEDGSMYCVPTAALNIFGYAANHGFPDVNPGPANWQLQSNYVAATLWINSMGSFMGTDPIEGTTGGAGNGFDAFLQTEPFLKKVIRRRTASYTPNAARAARLGCQGWVLEMVYGKYEVVDEVGGIPVVERTGGHAVSLVRAYRDANTWIVRYRDPADDEANLTTQSTFVNKERYPWTYVAYFGSATLQNFRAMTAIFASSGKTRIIDELLGIRPLYGLSFTNNGDTAAGGQVDLLDPIPFTGSPTEIVPCVVISNGLTVMDIGFDPDFEDALLLTKSAILPLPSRLQRLDIGTGALSIMDPAPQNLVKFVTDRHGHIHAFDIEQFLWQLDGDGTPLGDAVSVQNPTALFVDDKEDVVWVLSVPQRKLFKLSLDHTLTYQTISIPTAVPMSGDGSVFIDRTTGVPWIRTAASPNLYGIVVRAVGVSAQTFSHPALNTATRVEPGDSGEIFVLGDGSVKVMSKTSTYAWALDPAHPFHGKPAGSRLALLRNSDNYDPALHEGPGWFNLPAAEIQDFAPLVGDCLADLNSDDIVNGADIGILLGNWGAAGGPADLDGSGLVNGADLGVLLGTWGACP